MKLRKTNLNDLHFNCEICGNSYMTLQGWARCHNKHLKEQKADMENITNANETNITVNQDKQLQLLDRAITYATNSGIPLAESWKTINELLTPKVTLGEHMKDFYGTCKTFLELKVINGHKGIKYECQLPVNHKGMHQTPGGAQFSCGEK